VMARVACEEERRGRKEAICIEGGGFDDLSLEWRRSEKSGHSVFYSRFGDFPVRTRLWFLLVVRSHCVMVWREETVRLFSLMASRRLSLKGSCLWFD
jgi:hypothetical protein